MGVDDHVVAYLLAFVSWWHSGMKRPGLTLRVLAHETCSTLDMQLALHKWLAGVCLFHYSHDPICNGLLNNLIITVVVDVRR